MIDKPLYGNPLAGGSGQLGGATFRQEGDMGRYVAFNDPGQPGAGFSNLEDYLAAGNQLPQLSTGEPLKGVGGMFNVTPPSVPVSEQTLLPGIIDPRRDAQRKADEEFLKTADEYQRGFRESEFYKPGAAMTADLAEFIYSSPTRGDITMKGSSSGIGQFRKYLESIGKGDLLQRAGGSFSQETGPLATVGPNVGNEIVPYNPNAGQGVGLDGKPLLDGGPSLFPFPGMNSTEVAMAETQTVNPFQEQFTGFQNQLTGFGDQFSTLGDRLTKVEEGIASLLNQNRGFGFNSMQPRFGAPNYGFSPFSMVGLGSLFGGYYG